MPKQRDLHVVQGVARWRVEVEGTPRPQTIHKTQFEDASAACDIACRNRSELLIHRRSGRSERSVHGPDPRRAKS
jgi:hypothetical protein